MEDSKNSSEFIRYVMCFIPMGGSLVAGVLIVFGDVKDYKWNKSGVMTIEDEFADA